MGLVRLPTALIISISYMSESVVSQVCFVTLAVPFAVRYRVLNLIDAPTVPNRQGWQNYHHTDNYPSGFLFSSSCSSNSKSFGS